MLLLLYVITGCNSKVDKPVKMPYSQWTVSIGSGKVYWTLSDSLQMNSSFIEAPEADWDQWYQDLERYRDLIYEKISIQEPVIRGKIAISSPAIINFDKFVYDLTLQPRESMNISGELKSPDSRVRVMVDYELKATSGELSYIVENKIEGSDSLIIYPSDTYEYFRIRSVVPEFNADSFSIAPVIRFEPIDSAGNFQFNLKNISPEVKATPGRLKYMHQIEKHLEEESRYPKFRYPKGQKWMDENYVMGFAFLWDNELWDYRENKFKVDYFCQKMLREFGGFNSVILWYTYPNIGIDQRNQFDFLYGIPGGLDGLKDIIADFHRNDVRVFLSYIPWDLSTRPVEYGDATALIEIIKTCKIDGIFLDSWNSSAGNISVFTQKKFLRERIERTGIRTAIITERTPTFKDLTGSNILSGSWEKNPKPFNYTDLSHIKWLLPWHKQYYLNETAKNRKRQLAHSWINGQAIMVHENIYGSMNPWQAEDRQFLRKMNAIWRKFGEVYLSADWQPLIPVSDKRAVVSSWNSNGYRIWNIVNTADREIFDLRIRVDTSDGKYFYDLWNGAQIYPEYRYNGNFISTDVRAFSCLLQTDSAIHYFHDILSTQQLESIKEIPGIFTDRHIQEISLKEPVEYSYENPSDSLLSPYMLFIPGGDYYFETKHILREGSCYPDADAVDNHDLNIQEKNGMKEIIHTHRETMQDYHIMPAAVTNAEFELFLDISGYEPEWDHNFLKHWNGRECPDEIRNEPVVYVSLEDARAFADWAGMKLPTEWQWQKAAEFHPRDFLINEVYEWNESERFDGFNHFVNLRGGCSTWIPKGSGLYFPGAQYGKSPGGIQRYNSHSKYLLMYPGLDRASTIGFRCVWQPPEESSSVNARISSGPMFE